MKEKTKLTEITECPVCHESLLLHHYEREEIITLDTKKSYSQIVIVNTEGKKCFAELLLELETTITEEEYQKLRQEAESHA